MSIKRRAWCEGSGGCATERSELEGEKRRARTEPSSLFPVRLLWLVTSSLPSQRRRRDSTARVTVSWVQPPLFWELPPVSALEECLPSERFLGAGSDKERQRKADLKIGTWEKWELKPKTGISLAN
nr:uncharacterized protein LOC105469925 [Macaca nemestrina]